MKITYYITLAIALLICSCGSGSEVGQTNGSKEIVGGGCSYQGFPGTCSYTSTEDGLFYFIYKGTVNGNSVVLNENITNNEIKGDFECSLEFIKTGTCTPCIVSSSSFNIGECGDEAWDLFQQ